MLIMLFGMVTAGGGFQLVDPPCGAPSSVVASEARREPSARVLSAGPGEVRVRILLSQLLGDLNSRAANELSVRYGVAEPDVILDRFFISLRSVRGRQASGIRITTWNVDDADGNDAVVSFRLNLAWTNPVGAQRTSLFDGAADMTREDGTWQLKVLRLRCARK